MRTDTKTAGDIRGPADWFWCAAFFALTFATAVGAEFLPLSYRLQIADEPIERTFPLQRWIDLARRGWYSGETHVHRRIAELPNVMLAEDLSSARSFY